MNCREAVERQILRGTGDLDARKELWREIFIAYEEGGKEKIKAVLTKYSDEMARRFDELLEELRKRF
jgi:molybdenum-dependent DNA-binding transcriptional regulator ModE